METVEKMDPEEEKARLDLLLRDDFIDDLTSGGFMPVQLPMIETGDFLQLSVTRFSFNDFLSKYCGAPGGPRSPIFGIDDVDPLNFYVFFCHQTPMQYLF